MDDGEILDQKVIQQNGPILRVRRWWEGIRPEKGPITNGWTGLETLEEKDGIIPIHRVVADDGNKAA